MSEATPGPWRAAFPYVVAMDQRETIVCEVTGASVNEVAQADARLIAAAPDLLAALRESIDIIRTFHGPECWEIYLTQSPEMNRLRAAIAKATGAEGR